MRQLNLIKGDLKFIWKYGIVFVYIVFSFIYLLILGAIKGSAREITGAILVYTDPAAMGLFFMGAFLLLEKSQHVNCSLSVSPITISEYILSKVVVLLVPGTVVGTILALFSGMTSLLLVIPALVLSSTLFSLCGLIAAVNSDTLNGFMIAVIPFEILICVPAILSVFNVISGKWWLLHPGVAAMRLILGNSELWYFCLLSIAFWIVIVFCFARKSVAHFFRKMEVIKVL